MAQQTGIMRLSGPLGDFSFYEMKGKDYVRKKTRHAVGVDPRFDKTYLKGLDFGTASRASKLLRQALGPAVLPCCDDHMAQRLSGRFVRIVGADGTHILGKRQVLKSNLHFLKGFEFNKHSAFEALGISATPLINRATGEVKLTVSARSRKLANTKLVTTIASVDFASDTCASHAAVIFTIGRTKRKEVTLSGLIPDLRGEVIVALGVSSTAPDQPGAMAVVAVLTAEAGLRQASVQRREKTKRAIPIRMPVRAMISKAISGPVERDKYLSGNTGMRRRTFTRD
jgi:hypothetical protein